MVWIHICGPFPDLFIVFSNAISVSDCSSWISVVAHASPVHRQCQPLMSSNWCADVWYAIFSWLPATADLNPLAICTASVWDSGRSRTIVVHSLYGDTHCNPKCIQQPNVISHTSPRKSIRIYILEPHVVAVPQPAPRCCVYLPTWIYVAKGVLQFPTVQQFGAGKHATSPCHPVYTCGFRRGSRWPSSQSHNGTGQMWGAQRIPCRERCDWES